MKICLLIATIILAAASIQAEPPSSERSNQQSKTHSPYEIGPPYKGRDGAAEAKKDLAQGRPKLKVYGLQTPSAGFYSMLLSSRLGIQAETIAGCIVTEDLTKYAGAYNAVIEKYAKRKFGDDIFERLMTEAEQLYCKYPTMDQLKPPRP